MTEPPLKPSEDEQAARDSERVLLAGRLRLETIRQRRRLSASLTAPPAASPPAAWTSARSQRQRYLDPRPGQALMASFQLTQQQRCPVRCAHPDECLDVIRFGPVPQRLADPESVDDLPHPVE